jgi:hypothetical protein
MSWGREAAPTEKDTVKESFLANQEDAAKRVPGFRGGAKSGEALVGLIFARYLALVRFAGTQVRRTGTGKTHAGRNISPPAPSIVA